MKKVIVDTNALMAIGEFGVDIFSDLSEYKVFVLEGTVIELKKIIKEQRGKYKRAAKLALSLLKFKKIKVLKGDGYVDDLLIAYSKRGYLVLTQDLGVKRRLKKPYLTIRQKKRVVVIS